MPSIFDALIQQESGGRAGAIGPKTKYGRALGLTQMLPATAAEMARKIGVPFDPSLLKDTSPQGAQYQRKLGEAYFNEGLERTGNERDALRYYHGGPDRAQWGPKTNKYADSVLARAGGTPMIRPRKPQPKAAAMQPVPTPFTGPDPLAPMPEAPSPLAAALAPVAPQADPLAPLPGGDPKKKGGIFGSGLNGWDILGSVADGYLLANGQQGAYTQGQRQEREMQFDREKFNQELEAKREAAMQPRLEQVGNAIGMVDPATGQFTPTYTGPESQTSLQQNIAELRRMKPDITDEEVAAIIQQNITNPIMPRMVTYAQGDQTITEQINPDGSRKPVASAPRWAPPKAPAGPRASGPPAGFILD
jgi:hypothetical protein